jgi:hypothetical protein
MKPYVSLGLRAFLRVSRSAECCSTAEVFWCVSSFDNIVPLALEVCFWPSKAWTSFKLEEDDEMVKSGIPRSGGLSPRYITSSSEASRSTVSWKCCLRPTTGDCTCSCIFSSSAFPCILRLLRRFAVGVGLLSARVSQEDLTRFLVILAPVVFLPVGSEATALGGSGRRGEGVVGCLTCERNAGWIWGPGMMNRARLSCLTL